MPQVALRQAAPYLLLLVVAGIAFWLAGQIAYSPRPGQLGPDVWPRFAACLVGAVCVYELVRILAARSEAVRGVAETLDREGETVEPAPTHPGLLLLGILLTVAYGFVVPVLGFLFASLLYLLAFMYIGRYRGHAVIWGSSFVGIVLLAFIFLKLVYVSLPRGVPPFDRITDLVTMF